MHRAWPGFARARRVFFRPRDMKAAAAALALRRDAASGRAACGPQSSGRFGWVDQRLRKNRCTASIPACVAAGWRPKSMLTGWSCVSGTARDDFFSGCQRLGKNRRAATIPACVAAGWRPKSMLTGWSCVSGTARDDFFSACQRAGLRNRATEPRGLVFSMAGSGAWSLGDAASAVAERWNGGRPGAPTSRQGASAEAPRL